MSFGATVTITIGGAPQTIGPSDLVRFSPTAVSAANVITAGAFTLERTAAAMGLPPETANIDALDRTPDGRQLMSFADDLTLGAQTFSTKTSSPTTWRPPCGRSTSTATRSPTTRSPTT